MPLTTPHGDAAAAAVYSGFAAARSSIASSWHRSLVKYGLDPSAERTISRVETPDLSDRQGEMYAFLNVASDELDRLFSLIGESGCGLYLTDSSGVVLDHRCKDGLHRTWQPMGEWIL